MTTPKNLANKNPLRGGGEDSSLNNARWNRQNLNTISEQEEVYLVQAYCNFQGLSSILEEVFQLLVMTALDPKTQVPPSVNTAEKLAAWAILLLARQNPDRRVIELIDEPSRQVVLVTIIKAEDNSYRLIGRVSLKLDAGYAENAGKFWTNVEEFANTEIPTAFTTA